MYWVVKKIGLFFFFFNNAYDGVGGGERELCLALIVLGWGWVPGALPKISRPREPCLGLRREADALPSAWPHSGIPQSECRQSPQLPTLVAALGKLGYHRHGCP